MKTKSEQAAINMLNRGISVTEIAQKTGLSKVWLELQREKRV